MDLQLPISGAGIEDEQRAFADAVRGWADRELIARRGTLREDYDALLRPALRGLLLELGLQAHLWPEAQGGDGQRPEEAAMTLALALEQVGRGDVGVGFVAACQLATAAAIRGGERSAALAPLLCPSGGEAIVAPVLPTLELGPPGPTGGQGRPWGRPAQATARADGERWIVDGEDTRPLGCGQDAALLAVLCRLEPAGSAGLLLVPADAAGVRRGAPIRQTGLAAARNCLVTFRGVVVPGAQLALEGEARGLRTWLALFLAALSSGALLSGLEILGDWAESRVIKGRGQRFVDNSLVAELMAALIQRSTLVRLVVRDLARVLGQPGEHGAADTAPVSLAALGAAQQVARWAGEGLSRAMELMGSAGYATEWNLERHWRDTRTLRSLLGSPTLDRLELAACCFGHGGH